MLIYQNENIGHSFEYRYGLHNDGFSVPLHIHEYSELLYVIEGRMKLAIDGKSMCAEAGQMAFVFPNQSHEYTKEFECKCFCAVFSNDFLQPFFGIYPDMIKIYPSPFQTEFSEKRPPKRLLPFRKNILLNLRVRSILKHGKSLQK